MCCFVSSETKQKLMDKVSDQIEQLIINSVSGVIDSQGQAALDDWLAQSPDNTKEYEAYIKLWKNSHQIVLSDSVNVEASLRKTKKLIPDFNRNKRLIIYLRQAAAVILLSIVFSGLIHYSLSRTERNAIEDTVYQEIRTAYGTQSQVNLPDGTLVWLNSGSILRYPESFSGKDVRSVELNGEGYFNVSKDARKPFIINTSDINIKVTGTEFNVSAYSEYQSTTIALTSGKVTLFKTVSGVNKNLLELSPNDVAEYNKSDYKLSSRHEASLQRYVAWKEGILVFYGDPIEEVIQKLEKWYNVKINITDREIVRYRLTATFIDEPLEQVLKLISISSPLRYKIEPAHKLPDDSFSKRIITISKK